MRRNVGALFVEEIGSGGMFQQSDLQEEECYILDSGGNIIFLWHGIESSYQSQALCTRVCRKYISELKKDHDACASPEFRDIFPLPASQNIEIIYQESGHESLEFIYLFPKWIPRGESRQMLCNNFDPSSITDDDDDIVDDKFDRAGHLIISREKISYRASHAHLLHPSHDAIESSSTPSLHIPHSLRPSDATAASHLESNKQNVPEFIAKRNSLKVVYRPDINHEHGS